MYDPDGETRYEIEVILGTLDESHIIRTIEYWDIERQRYPTLEHRAVIVAEEITSRFFNVIRLLNRAVSIIALQLNAFRFGDSIVLHFTKVLHVYESPEEDEGEAAEPTDRRYGERWTTPGSLAIVDQIVSMIPTSNGNPQVTYNKFHIAMGTIGYNFWWFHPRRSASHCHVQIRVGNEARESMVQRLEDAGMSVGLPRRNSFNLKITAKELQENALLLQEALLQAERWSQTRGGEA
jgi:hypothetical protein